MEKSKRQERFVQKSRFKNKARKSLMYQASYQSPKVLGKLTHTRALCSCTMCGNPRRHFGETTLQEKSLAEVFNKVLLKNIDDIQLED
jgi:hypothetical protein